MRNAKLISFYNNPEYSEDAFAAYYKEYVKYEVKYNVEYEGFYFHFCENYSFFHKRKSGAFYMAPFRL